MEKTRDEKNRDTKLEEMALKSLGNHTPEEKLNILIKKYVEFEKENKKLNTTIKQHEKRSEAILREKDNLQKEYNKGVLIKDKLEQVCREQQKLIKSVKNESLSKIREEEERRKENQVKFQQTINEINQTLTKNNDENNKLRDDNIDMSKKLKYLADQYHTREQQIEKIHEQINLESQLNEAKLTKIQMEAAIEKETILREKQKALDDLLGCKKMIQEMHTRETALKEQLHLYTSKYDDFQNSLQKSNKIFTSYKTELEKMSKNSKKLEKDNQEWRRKFEKSNASLIELATEKQAKDEYVAKCAKQVNQLQKLLRTLQVERTSLHQVLKDNNIERPPLPVLPPEPEPILLPPPPQPQQKDKMDIMQKNCAELKQTLAKLQGQMNAITAKQTEVESTSSTKPEPTAATTNKKTKNKNKKKNKVCPTKITDNDDGVVVGSSSSNVQTISTPSILAVATASTDATVTTTLVDVPMTNTNTSTAAVAVTTESSNKPSPTESNSDITEIEETQSVTNITKTNMEHEDIPMTIEALVAAVLMQKNKSLSTASATAFPPASIESTLETSPVEIQEDPTNINSLSCSSDDIENIDNDMNMETSTELVSNLNNIHISNEEFVVVNQSDTVEITSEN